MRPEQIEAKREVEERCCVSCKWVNSHLLAPADQRCVKWVDARAFDPIFGFSTMPRTLIPLVAQRSVDGLCGPTGTGWEIDQTYACIMLGIETEKIGVQP